MRLFLAFILLPLTSQAFDFAGFSDYFVMTYGPAIESRYSKPLNFGIEDMKGTNSTFAAMVAPSIAQVWVSPQLIAAVGEDPLEMAAVLCHEVGHGIAGGINYPPREVLLKQTIEHGLTEEKREEARMALANLTQAEKDIPLPYAEGEADYFSSRCLYRYLADTRQWPKPSFSLDKYTSHSCNGDLTCSTILQIQKNMLIHVQSAIYDEEEKAGYDSSISRRKLSEISYDLSSDEKPRYSNFFYPSVQCRLDTFKAGYFRTKRPRCWKVPIVKANLHFFSDLLFPKSGSPTSP